MWGIPNETDEKEVLIRILDKLQLTTMSFRIALITNK